MKTMPPSEAEPLSRLLQTSRVDTLLTNFPYSTLKSDVSTWPQLSLSRGVVAS